MDALTANGTTSIQTSVTGVTAGKRKFIDDRRDQPFDKRLRFSVRQTESAYRYRDIVVRKQDGFTHILLSTKSSENNSLNPEVRDAPRADLCFMFLHAPVSGACFAVSVLVVPFVTRLLDHCTAPHWTIGSRGEAGRSCSGPHCTCVQPLRVPLGCARVGFAPLLQSGAVLFGFVQTRLKQPGSQALRRVSPSMLVERGSRSRDLGSARCQEYLAKLAFRGPGRWVQKHETV